MHWNFWLGSLLTRLSGRARNARADRVRRAFGRHGHVAIERLEDRTLLTTFTVNSFVDRVDANPGNGSSDDGVGNSTLRAAIMESNARFGQDTIVLPAGTFKLTLGGVDEDGAATGDLDITDDLTIVGAGAGQTIIDADGLDRVFHILSNGSLNISGVTIRGGSTFGDGGGILNENVLGVTSSVLENNTAGGRGGAIANRDQATLESATIRQNVAEGDGGGVYNADQLTVTRSTILNNVSRLRGGGLYNTLPAGGTSENLVITESTISGNDALSRGGGIYSADELTLVDSTVSGNTAGSRGGGVFNADTATFERSTISGNESSSRGGGVFNDGTLTMTTSTVSGNTVLPGASPTAKQGGGIYNEGTLTVQRSTVTKNAAETGGGLFQFAGTASLANTILAANTVTEEDSDVTGAVVSAGNNFIGDVGTATGLVHGTNGDLVGGAGSPALDPQLRSLEPNGGPTRTHAPRPGSPVIDRGNSNALPSTDQRGLPRNVDGNRDGTATPDIGSVEFQPTPDPIGPKGTISSVTPTFQWTSVPGAVRYDLWVNDVTTGQSGIIRETNLPSNSFTPDFDLDPGHHYLWTVRAFFANDIPGDWAAHTAFFVQSNVVAPNLLGPTGVTTDDTPTFTWEAVPGATRYDLWVNNLTTGQSAVIREQNLTGTSFTPTSPMLRGSHYIWTVSAFNASGVAGPQAPHLRFKIERVEAPELLTPTVTTIDRTPTFRWTAVDNAARYDIWVNNLSTGEIAVIRDQNVTGTSYTPTVPLEVGHRFIWTVAAIDSAGTVGPQATHATFSIVATNAASPPIPLEPDSGTIDTTPTFRWSEVTGAARYGLHVVNQSTGETVISGSNVTSESFTPTTPLQAGISYRWRVRAFNEDGNATRFSNEAVFTVTNPTAQPAPVLEAPVGVTTIDSTPTFRWSSVPGASRYDLWVNNLTTGQSGVIRQTTLTTNSYTPPTALTVGHAYIWTVTAINDDGTSTPPAQHKTFAITAPSDRVPTLQSPGGDTIDSTPTFQWAPVPGAAHYELRVNNTTTGASNVIHLTDLTTNSFTPTSALTVGDTYNWTVRAITDNGSATSFASSKLFTIKSPSSLGAPALLAPGSTAPSTRPTFQWSAVNGAAGYDLWVNNQTTGQSAVIRERNLTSTSFTPTVPLTAGHTYIWTVSAFNDSGETGPQAAHRIFTVSSSLQTPVAISPGSTTTDTTPTFVWTVVPNAVRYDLWVNDQTTGQSAVIRNQNIQTTAYTHVIPLQRGHSYIWTVRALDSSGIGSNWAAHKTFKIVSSDVNALQDSIGEALKLEAGAGSDVSPAELERALAPQTPGDDPAMMLAEAADLRALRDAVREVQSSAAAPMPGAVAPDSLDTLTELAFADANAAELWEEPIPHAVETSTQARQTPTALAALWPAGLLHAFHRLRRRKDRTGEERLG